MSPSQKRRASRMSSPLGTQWKGKESIFGSARIEPRVLYRLWQELYLWDMSPEQRLTFFMVSVVPVDYSDITNRKMPQLYRELGPTLQLHPTRISFNLPPTMPKGSEQDRRAEGEALWSQEGMVSVRHTQSRTSSCGLHMSPLCKVCCTAEVVLLPLHCPSLFSVIISASE